MIGDPLEAEKLEPGLSGLVGTRLVRITPGALSELHLWFSPGPPFISEPDFESHFALSTESAQRLMISGGEVTARDSDPLDKELEGLSQAKGSTVVSARVRADDFALALTFDQLDIFVLLTLKSSDAEDELPHWQLFTPDRRVFVIQRRGVVDVVPSDVSIIELEKKGMLRR